MNRLEFCHPETVDQLNRRQLLTHGVSLSAFLSLARCPGLQAADVSYPVQRKLIWINMNGGWDTLEVVDPKPASTSGISLAYDYSLANRLNGSSDDVRIGRFLPNLAALGSDVLLIRGLAMGTTSHNAGPVYMDTGVLSNTGRVNSASIPTIVASESAATIPIIQLAGGMSPQTDRGLAKKSVSVVRAENLELYRQMFPQNTQETEERLKTLDYIEKSITRLGTQTQFQGATTNDRLATLLAAQQKVKKQLTDQVGQKLALTQTDISDFMTGASRTVDRNIAQTFALAQKMIVGDICDCVNLGIGGFDTHANQTARLQPVLDTVDFVVSRLATNLKEAGKLDSTLIVLYSDFGRTPKINNQNGRDHWPVGGCMFIGGGIAGGRAVGGTDDDYRAISINPDTGFEDGSGIQINPTHVAGSVLELTLGASYLQYRNYLSSISSLTRLK